MDTPWGQKEREGKMFTRVRCARCGMEFHFTESPRGTRVPRCPACGGLDAHDAA